MELAAERTSSTGAGSTAGVGSTAGAGDTAGAAGTAGTAGTAADVLGYNTVASFRSRRPDYTAEGKDSPVVVG